jgi:hypothetical protein
MKEGDMGRANKTHGREETYAKCWEEERDHLRDLGIDGGV